MALAGFDPEYYLEAKLTALMDSGSPDWDADTLEVLLGALGYTRAEFMEDILAGCGLTPEEHYLLYGWSEGLSPNPYFDTEEYILAKAAALFESGGYESPEAARDAFEKAWPHDPYEHYLLYGASEGINPSNDFDASDYLAAKLAALLANPKTAEDWLGKTVEDLEAAFKAAGLTPLTHFLLYGRGEDLSAPEVPEGERVDTGGDAGGSSGGSGSDDSGSGSSSGSGGSSDSGGSSGGSGGSTDTQGQTFTLSGGGLIQGTEGDDTFTGDPGEIGNATIAGKGGEDILTLKVDNARDHNAALTSTGLETACIYAYDDLALDLSNAADLEAVWSDNSDGLLTLDNVDLSVSAGIMGTDASLVVNFSDTAGDADEASLIFSEVSAGGTATADNIEALNVSGRDGASEIIIDADALETLNLEGSQDLVLHLADASDDNLTLVNAAGATGDMTVGLETTPQDITLTGGEGDDTFRLEAAASLAGDAAITGGGGLDTLVLYASAGSFENAVGAGDLNVSGVEILSLFTDGDGNDEIDFNLFAGPMDFTSVVVTATADGDGVTLTNTRADTVTVRNTDDGGDGADDIATITIDGNDTSGDTDALTIAMVNREETEDMDITAIAAEGMEIITLTGDPLDDDADSDITLATLIAGDLETLHISGAGNITLGSGSALTAETINGATATGNLDLTLGSADQTVTGGLGDDIFRLGSGLFYPGDTMDGGEGEDTLALTNLAVGGDVTMTRMANFETLDYTETANADGNATLDLTDNPDLDAFFITLEPTSDDILTFKNIQADSITAEIHSSSLASRDTIVFDLASDGSADEFSADITESSSDFFHGTLTLDDFETITLDFHTTDLGGCIHILGNLNAASAETLIFNNDEGGSLEIDDCSIRDGATIDLTGWESDIGHADRSGDSDRLDDVKDYHELTFGDRRDGITLTGANAYTVLLSDGRDGHRDTVIDLGDSNTNADIIRFTDSDLDDNGTNDIGFVAIEHFSTGTNQIDLSAYGVGGLDELILADASGNAIIMSAETANANDFQGSLDLIGVDYTTLGAGNFIFSA